MKKIGSRGKKRRRIAKQRRNERKGQDEACVECMLTAYWGRKEGWQGEKREKQNKVVITEQKTKFRQRRK